MDGMFLGVDLLLVSCLFLSAEAQTGDILPPVNLSLTWKSEFQPYLSWAPPPHSITGCSYGVENISWEKSDRIETNYWTRWLVMKEESLKFSVTTRCNNTISKPAVVEVKYPKLVESWNCYVYAHKQSYCSWEPAFDAQDVSFFYRLVLEGENSNNSSVIQSCPKPAKHGCFLEAGTLHRIFILFNATLNNTTVRNTFELPLQRNVKPPTLNWTVHETESAFNITWTPPDVCRDEWQYQINYTECKETKTKSVKGLSYVLQRVPTCPYSIAIRAVTVRGNGETPWSEARHFGTAKDHIASMYAAIIIPLVFAGLAAVTFVCCRKNKDTIFPKVPQPLDLLSDISDNNNKSTVSNLYIPAMEEETCKISLVRDSQPGNPDY